MPELTWQLSYVVCVVYICHRDRGVRMASIPQVVLDAQA